MILQTGMRTDIPAFYPQWFANRLKAGEVLVRNPYQLHQVTRYSLDPEVVDLIAFCSKNPGPMLPYMNLLKPYRGTYWFVTITPYGRDIEPKVPEIDHVTADFRRIADIVGCDSMGWRYDPIFINEKYSLEKHLETFEQIAAALQGYTKTCVISFGDLYEKVKRNFSEAKAVTKSERLFLGEQMVRIAGRYGMTVRPCGEGTELERFGADCSGCMFGILYTSILYQTYIFPCHIWAAMTGKHIYSAH